MRKWVDELFVIIMDMLQDSSLLAKRQVGALLPEWAGDPQGQGHRSPVLSPRHCL